MELVKIKMIDSGPNNNYTPGSLIEVDAARAKAMVDGGHAKYPCGYEAPDEDPSANKDLPKRRRAGG